MKPVVEISDLDQFALRIGIPKQVLTKFAYSADSHYKTFRVRKKSGNGYRTINAPSRKMKGIQRWISAFILRRIDLPVNATAFQKGSSIVKNASPHKKKDFIMGIDLSDFFPSIGLNRIYGLFRSLGYNNDVSFVLTKLVSYRGCLPQGAPSSPDIANIVCRNLDARLRGLATIKEWSYTRYCDDITISGSGGIGNHTLLLIRSIIESEGFAINKRKTRIIRSNRRQIVTGIVVNEKLNLPRTKRKRIRAMFFQAKIDPRQFVGRISELRGYYALLQMVDRDYPELNRYREIIDQVVAAVQTN
jgi:retron-type reverse transcriptase